MNLQHRWGLLSLSGLLAAPLVLGCQLLTGEDDYDDYYDDEGDGYGASDSGGNGAGPSTGGTLAGSGGSWSSSGSATGSGGSSSGGSSAAAGGASASSCSSASGPGAVVQERDEDGRGELSQSNVCVPSLGLISSLTLRYNMDSFFGEPTRAAVFAYQAGFDIGYSVWVAEVVDTNGLPVLSGGNPVYASWSEGAWPDPGGEFGFDSTGSPSWSQTFVFYSGGTKPTGYVDETTAKAIYTAGFSLDGLRMLSINDEAVLY